MHPVLPAGRRALAVALVGAAVTAAVLTPALPGGPRPAQATAVVPAASWTDHLNALRADYGSAPVVEDDALTAGAQEHALSMAGAGVLQGPQDGASSQSTAAGRAAAAHSLLAGPAAPGIDTPAEFVDLWARGAYTALALLSPSVRTVGYGQSALGRADFAALDVRSGRSSAAVATGWPRSWPSSRRPVALTTYTGAEQPSPVAGCGRAPEQGWGLPVLVSYGGAQRPTGVSASLSVDGTAVATCVVSADRTADPQAVARLDEAHSVIVVPRGPLRAGRTYTGTVDSSRGRVAIRFSVAADAPAVSRRVARVQVQAPASARAGSPVAVSGTLSVGPDAVGHRPVELWFRPARTGTWSRLATRPFPVASGEVRFSFPTTPTESGAWQARFSGGALEAAASSAARPVAVTTAVTGWSSTALAARAGATVRRTVTLTPALGRVVQVQRRTCSSCAWRTVSSVGTARTARAAVGVALPAVRGTSWYRLTVPGTPSAAGVSTGATVLRAR